MANPDIEISSEKLRRIHSKIQGYKIPTGLRGVIYRKMLGLTHWATPGPEFFRDIGDRVGLDYIEGAHFCFSANAKLGILIVGDFSFKQPFQSPTEQVVDERVNILRDRLSKLYEEETGLAAIIGRKHLSTLTRFGYALGSSLYQSDIDIPTTLGLLSTWKNTVLESGRINGYNPLKTR